MAQFPDSTFLGENETILTPTYKEQAYDLLKEAILYRRLKMDEVYSQDGLCTALKISRTPVREALLELQKEGYITFLRGRGIKIVSLTRKEAVDIVEMRAIIEQSGAELAAQRAGAEVLSRMQQNLSEMRRTNQSQMEAVALYKLDRQFHRCIFEAAGNSKLLESVENLRDQFLRVETLDAFSSPEKSRDVANEHEAIYKAIAAGDATLAKEMMREHLRRTYERTVKAVLEARLE